jgi:hypothetical protein
MASTDLNRVASYMIRRAGASAKWLACPEAYWEMGVWPTEFEKIGWPLVQLAIDRYDGWSCQNGYIPYWRKMHSLCGAAAYFGITYPQSQQCFGVSSWARQGAGARHVVDFLKSLSIVERPLEP